MCICELQLHRRYTGRRDDEGLGYTAAPISSAHRGIVYARPDEEMREPAALERVENLTVSYRSRLAVDAAACRHHRGVTATRGVARRARDDGRF